MHAPEAKVQRKQIERQFCAPLLVISQENCKMTPGDRCQVCNMGSLCLSGHEHIRSRDCLVLTSFVRIADFIRFPLSSRCWIGLPSFSPFLILPSRNPIQLAVLYHWTTFSDTLQHEARFISPPFFVHLVPHLSFDVFIVRLRLFSHRNPNPQFTSSPPQQPLPSFESFSFPFPNNISRELISSPTSSSRLGPFKHN